MSQQDFVRAVNLAHTDASFRTSLVSNWTETMHDAKLELDEPESAQLRRLIFAPEPVETPQTGAQAMDPRIKEKNIQNLLLQIDKRTELIVNIYQNIQRTFSAAHSTYHAINKMNYVMFGTGIGLFVTAGIYGAITHDKLYSFLFCGLGAASFVAQFMISPIKETQVALSNMAQTEIAIMNFLEQLMLLEPIALIPRADSNPLAPQPSVENIERSAHAIQQRALEAIQLLQDYVEPDLRGNGRAEKRLHVHFNPLGAKRESTEKTPSGLPHTNGHTGDEPPHVQF